MGPTCGPHVGPMNFAIWVNALTASVSSLHGTRHKLVLCLGGALAPSARPSVGTLLTTMIYFCGEIPWNTTTFWELIKSANRFYNRPTRDLLKTICHVFLRRSDDAIWEDDYGNERGLQVFSETYCFFKLRNGRNIYFRIYFPLITWIKMSRDRLTFNMRIPIPGKTVFISKRGHGHSTY